MRPLLALLLALTLAACATVDTFNQAAANLTREAITATEQNRCTVRPAPCLTDPQFRRVNVELNKISVAGQRFTTLRIAGKATTQDASAFLATLANEIGILARTFPDGVVGTILQKLGDLQQRATKLLGT